MKKLVIALATLLLTITAFSGEIKRKDDIWQSMNTEPFDLQEIQKTHDKPQTLLLDVPPPLPLHVKAALDTLTQHSGEAIVAKEVFADYSRTLTRFQAEMNWKSLTQKQRDALANPKSNTAKVPREMVIEASYKPVAIVRDRINRLAYDQIQQKADEAEFLKETKDLSVEQIEFLVPKDLKAHLMELVRSKRETQGNPHAPTTPHRR